VAKKSIDLLADTPRGWLEVVLDNFDDFLQDHANCERKASALAMSLVVKYADRTKIIPQLISIAEEELTHFRMVYQLMEHRNLLIAADSQDPYVQQLLSLLRHGRDERFLDRFLISSLIECRGAERFRLISQALHEPSLRRFYRDLWASEAKHSHQFVDMVLQYFGPTTVYPRLSMLAEAEASIMRGLNWRPALH
jgi:tRNA-(ms[2]io[6]A)-hydroxylase